MQLQMAQLQAERQFDSSVHANPSKATTALANRAAALGAHIFEGHEVKHVAEQNKGFHVITSKGSFQCGKLVIAAGAWAPAVGRQLGLDIPVVPVKGQMWATTPQPPGVIKRVIYAAESHSFWAQKCTTDYALGSPANVTHDAHTKQKLVRHVYGRQCRDGRIIFGGDRVVCDASDYKIDQDGIRLNQEHIAELLPVVKGLEVETTWSGIMPFSMDGKPHLGPVKCMQGVYVATGFSSSGFMLGPMAGVMLANTILGKHDDILASAEPCRPGPGGIRLLVASSARLPSKL
ncbi:hypothetical protein CYMTET_9556 [Cymbomonas tetramitiformis]|uniref:FAD dependent oxidoreductase domain-containing protein n=1 Tax=Cymbomonas tetramitiformis TaxID=36881 RepID=A0AAE0GRI6_9CHLO|nr:hypothetical protein CYMTET_9556 [Cymbomonas tetramitiformis]